MPVTRDQMDGIPLESASAFVMLSRLSTVLSSVMDNFYTVNRSPRVMSPLKALSKASQCQAELKDCLDQQGGNLLQDAKLIDGF